MSTPRAIRTRTSFSDDTELSAAAARCFRIPSLGAPGDRRASCARRSARGFGLSDQTVLALEMGFETLLCGCLKELQSGLGIAFP
jgi:hypothetical protein